MAEATFKVIVILLIFYKCSATKNVNTRYYPQYHFAPPYGWMNDPNGLSYFQDNYHLFYQYNPNSSESAGIAHWGHARSPDLIHWEHLPVAMNPDKSYDTTGVFSGSGIVVNNTLYLFYTGNVNFEDQIPDHKQVQALAYTTDGVNVTKYPNNPIINGTEYQPDFRDPKVWQYGDDYYMVLGNSNNNTTGRVLLYQSQNLIEWTQKSVLLTSNGSLGYMWECPDLFQLGEYYVLLFSPQGILPQGDKFKNKYQTGYFTGRMDHETGIFVPISEFIEMDHGHDFYATQTMLDKKGRRIMIAWMDMWEQVYPERTDGWTGMFTMPRELTINSEGLIKQTPLKEFDQLLEEKLCSGPADEGYNVTLTNKSAKVTISASNSTDFYLYIQESTNTSNVVTIYYNSTAQRMSVDRGGDDGLRRTSWTPNNDLKMVIYIDSSSLELFCGEGMVTFSSRFFMENEIIVILGASAGEFLVQPMKRSVPQPNS